MLAQGLALRHQTVQNSFQLGRHVKVIERRDQHDHVRKEDFRQNLLHGVFLDALSVVLITIIAGAAGADLLEGRVKTDDRMPLGRRPGDEFVGQQGGSSLTVGLPVRTTIFMGFPPLSAARTSAGGTKRGRRLRASAPPAIFST